MSLNYVRNLFHGVFFATLIVLSSSADAAAPVVIGSIPDQETKKDHFFEMSFETYEVFSDADNDALSVEVKESDDSALPAWLTSEEKPIIPSLVGIYDTPDMAFGVAVVGNLAYVADWNSGLQIINISAPSSPSLVGTYYNERSGANGVVVVGNLAFVSDSNLALQIIDISTPSSPSLVGAYGENSDVSGVAVVGNYAYVAHGCLGFKIIDISTPSSPSLVGTYDNTTSCADGVAGAGNIAYVAYIGLGLQIIDVSTPSSPSLVGTYNTTPYSPEEVVVVDNLAFIVGYTLGLQIIDISIPSNPSLVGTYDTPGIAHGVAVVGNYAYVADEESGLQIIDISIPSNPSFVGLYNADIYAYGVSVTGDYAYVADRYLGLQIIGGVGEGIQLSGTPTGSDVGVLNLKAIASDGVDEVSTTFSIDVQDKIFPSPSWVWETIGGAIVVITGVVASAVIGTAFLLILKNSRHRARNDYTVIDGVPWEPFVGFEELESMEVSINYAYDEPLSLERPFK